MRIRVVFAVVGLSLAVVTVTLARQQTREQQGSPRVVKTELRTRVVKNRAELELLQLEHEADKAHLLDVMKGIRAVEAASPDERANVAHMQGYFSGKGAEDSEKAFKDRVDVIKGYIERKKKDFIRQAGEVADKRLELSDTEKQYNDAR